jgi:hypothetical protein
LKESSRRGKRALPAASGRGSRRRLRSVAALQGRERGGDSSGTQAWASSGSMRTQVRRAAGCSPSRPRALRKRKRDVLRGTRTAVTGRFGSLSYQDEAAPT